MSYDLEPGQQPVFQKVQPMDPHDLEGITTVLQIAALYLTEGPDPTFTEEELLSQARKIVGDDFPFEDRDARIVIRTASFFQKRGSRLRLR